MTLSAAILAGGQSRRMGRDKAALPSLEDSETTMLARTIRLAQAIFAPVYVIGRPRSEDTAESGGDIRFVVDTTPGLGPAGGLATVLPLLNPNDVKAVVLLPCDLPLLSENALRWLRTEAEQEMGRHGLAVRNNGQIEPLFAVYKRDVLPLLEVQLAQSRRSLQKLIENGDFRLADAPDEIAATLLNVNTAEELAQVQSRTESSYRGRVQI